MEVIWYCIETCIAAFAAVVTLAGLVIQHLLLESEELIVRRSLVEVFFGFFLGLGAGGD